MELRQLRHFLCILRHGSINKAATSLNVTQPSLSHSIKALERSVGAQLLLRGGGGVRPTSIGEVFERYAQNILREADRALDEINMLRGGGRSKLSVGILSTFSASFAPKVFARFLADTKGIEVETHTFTDGIEVTVKRLRAAEWDLAITQVTGDYQPPPDMELRRIGEATSQVYCSGSHPLAKRSEVELADMAEYPWVITNVGRSERLILEAFGVAGLAPDIRIRTNSVGQMLETASSPPFLCIASTRSVRDHLDSGKLVKVDQCALRSGSDVAILHSNLHERTSAMRTFIRLCAELAAEAK